MEAEPLIVSTQISSHHGYEHSASPYAQLQGGPNSSAITPFLKWAGGKRSILHDLLPRIPERYGTYVEPFLGGGALFFAHQPARAYLSDINAHLVTTYKAVHADVDCLINRLEQHKREHGCQYYLQARQQLGIEPEPVAVAALFIYLNKTCFNGLYRVNQKGLFNVAMGSYKNPAIIEPDKLWACSTALRHACIHQHSYQQVPVERGNFYYLDAPYHGAFTGYAAAGFNHHDQEELAEFCRFLDDAGCWFMASNSDTPLIRSLYAGFNIETVSAKRCISRTAKQRGRRDELIIRNYAGYRTGVSLQEQRATLSQETDNAEEKLVPDEWEPGSFPFIQEI